ncbi:hypothetical protein TGAM01_v205052 [Trichoderma gamsii]|uniref:Uncharacterized protein n=1 Tax=Trichoderma gamsii TaxID=398673 RepID=A0A2P4ZPA7_9HYPO|nr:hypothetical protein TGAM01_v205052 [Trichoderma gamsii]PON26108.1 hypothetical protein TGAM01_v205052 [Trichoderma gamsii]
MRSLALLFSPSFQIVLTRVSHYLGAGGHSPFPQGP